MADLNKIFESFNDKKIVVIGDVMVDTYIKGGVNRISPEAPVPVVRFKSREHRLGGAANVALNVKALGAEPFICSIIGKDEESELFLKLIRENKLNQKGIIGFDDRVTTVKTRVIGNNQQLLRIDHEEIAPLSSSAEFALIEKVKMICEKDQIDAIIFEDYNKGILTEEVIKKVIEFANEKGIITTVDPKKDNFLSYTNVTLFKPNLVELKEGTGKDFEANDQEAIRTAVKEMNEVLRAKINLITLSEYGVYIGEGVDDHFIPAHLRNIADVSGAGDTVISAATLCLAAGLSLEQVGQIANLAGGLVCEHVGVVSVDKERLLKEALEL
jgi:rfaE bifunctional protein kinase chain/domain